MKFINNSKPSWSNSMSLVMPFYRNSLFNVRNNISLARKVLSLLPSFVPSHTKISKIKIPRNKSLLFDMNKSQTDGCIEAECLSSSPNSLKRVVLYLHGGAFVMCSKEGHRLLTWRIAKESKTRVLSIDYRLAPEHPFPLPLHDALSAYLYLLKEFSPNEIVLAGDSAGGGLCISLSLLLRDLDIPQPAGIVAFAPWLDLTQSMPSFRLNNFDYLPSDSVDPKWITSGRSQYYTKYDAMNTHYLVSPLFAKRMQNSTLPPTIIHIGTHERLRDESLMFAMTNPNTQLELYEDQVHVFQAFAYLNEISSIKSLQKAGEFIRNVTSDNYQHSNDIKLISKIGETLITRKDVLNLIEKGTIELEHQAIKKSDGLKHVIDEDIFVKRSFSFYRI